MHLYRKLFNRKKELLILGVALISVSVAGRWIAIEHWESLNWEVTGYHPLMPVLVLATAFLTMAILYRRRIHSIGLWGVALVTLVYGCVMTWMLWLR